MPRKICKDFIFKDLLINATETSRGEFQTVCPLCKLKKETEEKGRIYDKKKLYIDPGMTTGFCHVCQTTFFDKDNLSFARRVEQLNPLKLDNGITKINMPYMRSDPKNAESHDYLIKRCPQLYDKIDMSSWGFYCSNDKVVIKFMLNGDNYYYQLRYLHPERDNGGNRYYSPIVDKDIGKPLYFAGGIYNPLLPTVLVEGVFTALTERLLLGDEFNVVAVLGHYLTAYQKKMLQTLGVYNTLYIHMDEPQMSWDVRNAIKDDFSVCRVIKNWDSKFDSEELIREKRVDCDTYRRFLIKEMHITGGKLELKSRYKNNNAPKNWLKPLTVR